MNVFRIVYSQAVSVSADNHLAETSPDVHFQISRAAAYTGWLKDNFGGRRNGDLAVLTAIGLHARPLLDDDLELLIRLRLATPADRGRLYARVTDTGLADILGRDREKLREAANRLAAQNLIRILALPEDFRDSRGQYNGDRAYLLMVDQQIVSQEYGAALGRTVTLDRAALGRTVDPQNGLDRAALGRTKLIPMVNTLTNVSGARSAPAQPADNLSTPASGHAASRPTPAPAAALADDRLAGQDAVESGPENHPSLDALGRLNDALRDPKAASAFVELVKALEQQGGLNPAGFRCARIGISCQQDRREQVLADLRKMQARTDLKPKMIQNNMCAILAQHIGLIIGLGLEPDGRRRAVPGKDDYAAVGALVRAYGPERVWLTVCDIAGARIGGDPLDYLRAALSKDSRPAAPAKRAAGTGDFNELDYLKFQTAEVEQ